MKKQLNKKNAVRLTLVGLGLTAVSMLYVTGCGGGGSGDSGTSGLCNVPLEASLSNGQARIGGATTAVELVSIDSEEWTLFNVANELRATKVGMDESNVSSIPVKGFIRDIEIVTVDGLRYALLAMGDEGIAAVDVTDPSNMMVKTNVSVSYFHEGITWTEGGGDIVPDNNISSTRAPISSLVVYNEGNSTVPSLQLIIGDEGYGLHKTSLSNLLDSAPESNLTIDGPEVYTLQYAGENAWGGPKSLKLFGDKLFVTQGFLGMGIYDPKTLEQVGRYNLYTDSTEDNHGEDWFIDMNVTNEVQPGNIDTCTGMPDYKQASFEIIDVWHGGTSGVPTPWADFDRYGKFYYDARKIDVATFGDKTTAYIAYGLGGMVAVDVTGYDTATARSADCSTKNNFLEGKYLGYVPGLPAHGPDEETGQQSQSLFPYFGVGMLKEAGTVDVKVDTATKNVYFSDHFAGLMVIGNADNPANWHGTNGAYNYDNDTKVPLGDHWPDYEFVTSYDMTPVLVGEEEVPKFIADDPILLATGEVSGHGNVFALTDTFDQNNSGQIDVVLAAGGGGLNFIDVYGTEPRYTFDVPVHFATTDEIGADENGVATEGIINIGHAEGVTSYGNLLFLGDGPHGMSVWNIADDQCVPTDDVHLVANTLQSEYPIGDINPAPHAYDVVLDVPNQSALVMTQSRGLRRVTTTEMGTVGAPVLLYPKDTDIFEHNKDEGNVVDFMKMQDHTYGVALKGSLAFTADGSNGLTVYDLSKDPTDPTSGYIVSNIGGDTNSKPDLGRVTGVALWNDSHHFSGKSYAFVAAGSAGVGVVDVTDVNNMSIVKVFEPIKLEEDHVGKADGKSVAVKVVGDHAFFTYDSFGIVAYKITDLIAPLAEGTDPTKIWGKNAVDQRPNFAARFKLQDPLMFGDEDLAEFSGGAAGMDVVSVGGKNFFYVAYGDAGVIKIDWTNPAAPVLKEHANTVGSALDVSVINGRVYVADGSGGLVLLK